MLTTLGLFLKGAVIGIANIIPGVSGGTMMLVLGIYDRVLAAIERIRPQALRDLRGALSGSSRRGRLGALMREYDVLFVVWLAAGAGAAILGASYLMKWLLAEHHDPTYGFFLGIVLTSILIPYRLLRRRSWREALSALVAAGLTVALSLSMSGAEKVENARRKLALREATAASANVGEGELVAPTPATPATDPDRQGASPRAASPSGIPWSVMLLFFGVGTVAISAMVLPGVSGSFLLLLFGVYFDVLTAITERDFVILGSFALGCLVGLKLSAKILRYLLARFYSPTMAFLAGLMLGSLWDLWPFKERTLVGKDWIDGDPIWPVDAGANTWMTLGAAVVGAVIIAGFLAYETRQTDTADSDAPPPEAKRLRETESQI